MEKQSQMIIKVMGLALGLPSTILGIFFLIYYLAEEKKIISLEIGLVIILIIVSYIFYLIYRNVKKK